MPYVYRKRKRAYSRGRRMPMGRRATFKRRYAAGRIGRWYRRKRTWKMNKRIIPGSYMRSRHVDTALASAAIPINLGELYFSNFKWPDVSGTPNNDAMTSPRFMLTGIKIMRRFFYRPDTVPPTNGANANIGPVIANYALLQIKEGAPDDITLASELPIDFFRDQTTTSQARNFTSYGSGTAWSNSFNVCPINTNHKWRVLTHKRRTMNTYATGTNDWKRGCQWDLNLWMKFNKTFEYENRTDGFPRCRIFEVFWYNTIDEQANYKILFGTTGVDPQDFRPLATTDYTKLYYRAIV